MAKSFAALQKYREQADYTRAFHFTAEQARDEVANARGICEELERFLRSGGWARARTPPAPAKY